MTVWTADEVRRVGDAGELRASWFRDTQARGEGRIEAGGVTKNVVFARDDTVDDRIDEAYRRKYGNGSAVRAITSDLATSTTLRVDPA